MQTQGWNTVADAEGVPVWAAETLAFRGSGGKMKVMDGVKTVLCLSVYLLPLLALYVAQGRGMPSFFIPVSKV